MTSRLLVVGGGVIGCSIAIASRHLFDETVLFDNRDDLGRAASGAAIGGITPQSDDYCRGPLRLVAESSRLMYPAWLADLETRSGLTIPYLDSGLLQVATQQDELDRLRGQLVPEWLAQGFTVRHILPDYLRYAEPLLSERVLGGVLLPDEGALEPKALMAALVRVVRDDARIVVRTGTEVIDVAAETDGAAVQTPQGVVSGDRCVVAAGAWSDRLLSVGGRALFPVRGQAMEFHVPGANGYPTRHHIYSKIHRGTEVHSVYLVPRVDGRLVVGVTYEEGRWDEEPAVGSASRILDGLHDLIPRTANWRLLREWAGVRPGTSDGCPLIGPVDPTGRIVAATGHFGVGITLAPATAALVTSILSGQALTPDQELALRITDPRRFVG